ncbi:MAG: hypothetical protein ANABAC_0502 [Anaerolineae bacterium]|jgi:hypothetical protein|nr:MAG: hypothetical protein ANABAC_0502 [Anaerolineae bacterium]
MHTELLFPPRLIPLLAILRGKEWQLFVEQIDKKSVGDLERKAFVLFMVRLAGCMSCHSDTWRAHQGCEQCAKQAIRKFRGTDGDLIALYQASLNELITTLPADIEKVDS